MYDHTRKGIIEILQKIKADWYIYRNFSRKEIAEMIEELEELECPTYEVV
jgi:hypothetical protein